MDKPGFYKLGDELLYAPNVVYAPGFTLQAASHADYTYPQDGWHWFDSQLEAEQSFGINGQPANTGQWVEFASALVSDTAVNALIATASSQAPVLNLMLGVGLGQAAQGDAKTFVAAWTAARTSGLVDAPLVTHMQALATTYDLPAEFIAGLAA